MKKCIYCGKEYPDEAERCAIDGHLLAWEAASSLAPQRIAVSAPPIPEPSKSALTERQLELVEVVLVCVISFGGSILSSTFVFLGGVHHWQGAFPWVVQSVREGSCLGLLWYLLRRRGKTFQDLGLAWRWRDFGWALVLIAAAGAAFRVVYVICHASGLTSFGLHGSAHSVGRILFGGGIFVSTFLFQFINPFFEELIVRAYLMTEVKRFTNSATKAVLVSTLLQTSYHFYQGGAAAIADSSVFLIFSVYYAKTNRIAPVILAHLYSDVAGTLEYWIWS